MTLSELIIEYRNEHGISQRQMASQCRLSTGYISLIEKETNPQTGKPMVPSLAVLNKLAKGMGITLDKLLSVCDDMPVDISATEKTVLDEKETGGVTVSPVSRSARRKLRRFSFSSIDMAPRRRNKASSSFVVAIHDTPLFRFTVGSEAIISDRAAIL